MVKKAKRSEMNPSRQEPAPQAPKKPTIVATDTALNLPTTQGTLLHLSYWDLWFALVAVVMHDGDLDRLAKRIKEPSGFFYSRDSIERKRCHLRDLKRRLDEASVTPDQIVKAAGDLARTEKRRALKKVMDPLPRERELSEPMRN